MSNAINSSYMDDTGTSTSRRSAMDGSGTRGFFSNDFVDSADQKDPSVLTPQAILCGKYRLEHKISSGNMGNFWKAYDLSGERFVSLKIIPPDIQQYRNEMLRIKNTFQSVLGLNHEYISPVYALENDTSVGYFLVLKWIDDPTLADYKNEIAGPDKLLDKKLVLQILANIAGALDYSHKRGVIHRDLKPTNIFITKDGEGKFLNASLADLGLAAEIEESSTRLSSLAFGLGTSPTFMAPEQWQSKKQDERTDQYALAAIAYELFSGKYPFIGRNIELLRTSVLKDNPEYIHSLPYYANSALRKGMAKDKNNRFASCTEFVQALSNPYWPLKNFALKLYRKPVLPVLALVCILIALSLYFFLPMIKNFNFPLFGKKSKQNWTEQSVNTPSTGTTSSLPIELLDRIVVPDDCSSLNLALQRINESGTIFIKPGYYSLSQNLHINRDVKIIGGSPEIYTDVILSWEEQGNVIFKAPNAFITGVSFRITQKDQGLSFLAGKSVLEHCEIVSTEGAGIVVRGGNTTPVLKDCKIYNCGKEGIRIEDFSKPILEKCIISNNHIGISVSSRANPQINDSEIRESMDTGIIFSDSAKGSLKNSLITKNGLGVQISSFSSPLFEKNKITENNREGVRIEKDGSGTFRNNTLGENGTVPWHIERNTENIVRENNTPNQ
ncbi:MAG: right-handed parallel beta-helix repeat-containing protein [Planctomycetia bacterium]|nr:right-handed parallel beta-helix repeat-containing protein [Planctomycetia bacterium]